MPLLTMADMASIQSASRMLQHAEEHLSKAGMTIGSPIVLLLTANGEPAGALYDTSDGRYAFDAAYPDRDERDQLVDRLRELLAEHLTAEADDAISTMSLDEIAGVLIEGLLAIENAREESE